jgi:hypothetical protein
MRAGSADEALRSVCSDHDTGLTPRGARSFDNRVVSALRATPANRPVNGWRELVRACRASLSFEFCMQLAGGGLAAASVTAFLVVSALKPVPLAHSVSADEVRAMSTAERTGPPIPLESLFQSSTPRAAMLWASPDRSLRHAATERVGDPPREPQPRGGKTAPRRHGGLLHSRAMG